MNHRYKIRMFKSHKGDASLAPGTVVLPLERSLSLHASSLDEVGRLIGEHVRQRKLAPGCVYQICPLIGNPEPIRSVAIDDQGVVRRVLLDFDRGARSEFRRLRYPEEQKAAEHISFQPEAVPA